MDVTRLWQYAAGSDTMECPLSFRYGGRPFVAQRDSWQIIRSAGGADDATETVILDHPISGLRIECLIRRIPAFHAIDWVCWISNEGRTTSPLIEDFLPLSTSLRGSEADAPLVLRHAKGDDCCRDAFFPHDEPLPIGAARTFSPVGGRSSNGMMPFFNVAGPESGWMLAIGWTGQWRAAFSRSEDGSAFVQAGMVATRFRLKPGERVRSPRIVLMDWDGADMEAGHNQFRQLMLAEYTPKRDGQPAIPPIAFNSAAATCLTGKSATLAEETRMAQVIADAGGEAHWVDAYWYPQPWYDRVGDWFPRPDDFPGGLKPLADAVHAMGMAFVLWFEPERVMDGTRWAEEFAPWLLSLEGSPMHLVNLGEPEARQRVADFLDDRIKAWNVDIYRQDFNMDPLAHWRYADAPDRQGITEMKYVEGLYWVWDELRRRNPRLQIDNCASGGRRIDVELCRRSWPLWRSDFNDIHEGHRGEEYYPYMGCADQIHVSGLSLYVPIHAGPVWANTPYAWRSALTNAIVLYGPVAHFADPLTRQAIEELRLLRPMFEGDFHVLTPFYVEQTVWHAYQLHRPDLEQGCVFFFRRPDCPTDTFTASLRNIAPTAIYEVEVRENTFAPTSECTMKGEALQSFAATTTERPASVLVRYRRITS